MFPNQTFHRINCLAYSLADNANAGTGPAVMSLKLSKCSAHSTSKRVCYFCVEGSLELTNNQPKKPPLLFMALKILVLVVSLGEKHWKAQMHWVFYS